MAYKPLTICHWNASGLKNRVGTLINFIQTHRVDILLISETHLTATDRIRIQNFTIYRKDRINAARASGGVAIVIKQGIPHMRIPEINNTTLEVIGIKLRDNTHIFSVYNKPANHFSERDLAAVFDNRVKVLVAGDLNAKHASWNCNRNNRNGNALKSFADDNFLEIRHPTEHTHFPENGMSPTTIDIAITKNVVELSEPQSLAELDSDHNPVIFDLRNQIRDNRDIRVISYKNTDWKKFRETLNNTIVIDGNINTENQLETAIRKLTVEIEKAAAKHTKTHVIKTDKDPLPREIVDKIKLRNRFRKLWQRNRNPADRERVNNISREIQSEIKIHRNAIWRSKLEKLNVRDNTLWKVAKLIKMERQPVASLVNPNTDAVSLTDAEKAETLATTYENIHDLGIDVAVAPTNPKITQRHRDIINQVEAFLRDNPPDPHQLQNSDRKLITSPQEIIRILSSLNINKAPGPDGITNRILKSLPRKAIVQITQIVNAIIKLAIFPKIFKTALVIPVFKHGKNPSDPKSYRPISLLNGIAKLVEKVINERLNRFDRKQNLTPAYQFGFREKHNTVQQVARIVNDVIFNYNKAKNTAMALFDIEKAFDRVWIDGLTFKLFKQTKIPPKIIKLIHSYLTEREFKVKVGNATSALKSIKAGVPQGSVLGPKLFNLFIRDIPTFKQTNLALYADDTAIYAHSFSSEVATRQVQIHANMLAKFYDEWLITLNAGKTEMVNFTRKFTNVKIITPLSVGNAKILEQPSVKYLGVQLDKRLNYQPHIQKTLASANATLRKLYPLLAKNNAMTSDNKTRIYKTIIRPILTYAAPVWCSISDTALLKLQRFQNKCLRLATNNDRYARIQELHETTNTEMFRDHINRLSEKFYHTQIAHNPLTNSMTSIRSHNHPRLKHKLTYQTLTIFQE